MKPTKKTRRTDHAERLIAAPLVDVFAAFTSADKLARWLPPEGATGEFEHCDLSEGGGFLMRLTFDDPDIETKSDDDAMGGPTAAHASEPRRTQAHYQS